MTTEEMHNISFSIPVSLRDELMRKIEQQGVETVNTRVVNAIKFAFTDNPIPFADEYDSKEEWVTKDDIENWMQPLIDDVHSIEHQGLNLENKLIGIKYRLD